MPNITTNHAITYTNYMISTLIKVNALKTKRGAYIHQILMGKEDFPWNFSNSPKYL